MYSRLRLYAITLPVAQSPTLKGDCGSAENSAQLYRLKKPDQHRRAYRLGHLNDVSSEAESCPTQTDVSRPTWMSNRGIKHVMRLSEHVYSMLSDAVIRSPTRFIKPSLDHHLCTRNMHEKGTPYVLEGEASRTKKSRVKDLNLSMCS